MAHKKGVGSSKNGRVSYVSVVQNTMLVRM